jgi:elongation factor G
MSFDSKNMRNVVLLGHSGVGKTTLAEAMLFEAGEISRRGSVQEGNTVSDYTDLEHERGGSLFATLEHVFWKDSKINLIDTPGLDDYIGEVVSALRVATTAVLIHNARSGVEVGAELLWEYIETFDTPAIFVINQVDHEKADFDATLEQAVSRFGSKVSPFESPVIKLGIGAKIIMRASQVLKIFHRTK